MDGGADELAHRENGQAEERREEEVEEGKRDRTGHHQRLDQEPHVSYLPSGCCYTKVLN